MTVSAPGTTGGSTGTAAIGSRVRTEAGPTAITAATDGLSSEIGTVDAA